MNSSTIKTALVNAVEAVKNIPVSTVLKAGIFVGAAAFTLIVLIKKTKKTRKTTKSETRHSPVDDLLGRNFTSDPNAFDDLDDLAKDIAKNVNPSKGKTHRHTRHVNRTGKKRSMPKNIKEGIKRSKQSSREFSDWARNNSRAYKEMMHDAAKGCGLPISDDDDFSDSSLNDEFSFLF